MGKSKKDITQSILKRIGDYELKGKDVLYLFETFTQARGMEDKKLIQYANVALNINEDLSNVTDYFNDLKVLKIAKAIQMCKGETVFEMIRKSYGEKFKMKFEYEVKYTNFADSVKYNRIEYITF